MDPRVEPGDDGREDEASEGLVVVSSSTRRQNASRCSLLSTRPQKASSGKAIIDLPPAMTIEKRALVSGSRRSMKKRAVAILP